MECDNNKNKKVMVLGSFSKSQTDTVQNYIKNQKTHHKET
jgi:hypothetical protein